MPLNKHTRATVNARGLVEEGESEDHVKRGDRREADRQTRGGREAEKEWETKRKEMTNRVNCVWWALLKGTQGT